MLLGIVNRQRYFRRRPRGPRFLAAGVARRARSHSSRRHAHHVDVHVAPFPERRLALRALEPESDLLIRAPAALVAVMHFEPHAVEIERVERVAHHEARGLRPVPASPLGRVADLEAEARVSARATRCA